jgi:drug/metabolite transporter (DMT)-like permease
MPHHAGNGAGSALAVLSAATFGTSGAFASSLIDAGWSPGAAVTARIVTAALILTVPALIQLRGRWQALWRSARVVAAYGLIAVAGSQLFYFNAVAHLSVGVALLLEYLGIILVVVWVWLRYGRRPRRLTLIGAGSAIVGLLLVLDLTGTRISMIGVLWGLGAACGLAVYFVLSSSTEDPLPPLVMAWSGMVVGGVTLGVLGALDVIPMHAHGGDVRVLHHDVSWVVPVLGLSLVAAVIAYVTGIGAARLLGARLASFVGLLEVVFAVIFAWVLLGQVPTGLQCAGGAFILAGVAVVRIDELRDRPTATYDELPLEPVVLAPGVGAD